MTLTLNQLIEVVYHSAPECDLASDEYREQLYDLFLPVANVEASISKRNKKRRYILSFFLNGRLEQSELQHFCAFHCCSDFEHTLARMRRFVAWALVPCKPPLFARSRWNKWDHALDYVGLLGGIHGLLPELVASFLGPEKNKLPMSDQAAAATSDTDGQLDQLDDLFESLKPSRKAKAMPMPLQNPQQSDLPEQENNTEQEPSEQPQEDGQGPSEQPQEDGQGPSEQPQEDGQNKSEMDKKFDWAEFNRQQKILTRKWVESDPFNRLSLMKECAEPLLHLMYKFLLYSGDGWEKGQQLLAARGFPRTYVVTEKAAGFDDQWCIAQLYDLLSSPPQVLRRDASHIEALALLRFRAVSSALCSLHVLLRLPHQNFPFKLFKLLDADDYAEDILAEPFCKRDALATQFLRIYVTWAGV